MKMVLDLMLETVLQQYSLHYFATVTLVTQGFAVFFPLLFTVTASILQ